MRSASKVEPAEREIPFSLSAPTEHVPAIWISWNTHRRSSGLCAAWDLPLQVVPYARGRALHRLRWFEQACRTLALLWRTRPEILFVQNPSLVLTTLALSSRRVFGYTLVVDAHNEGVRPFARRGRLVQWLTRRLLKGADATIVTNAALAKDVIAAGGRALVLPDGLPAVDLPAKSLPSTEEEAPLVAVISSFMADEPIPAILTAAAKNPGVRFAFTGDARRFRRDLVLPDNVQFTGYLAERAFWRLLAEADVILDLSLKPDCLVCGAYEALALAKPMVLSNNAPTRELFGPVACLTNNEPADIARAVREAVERRDTLATNARALRDAYTGHWQQHADATWNAITHTE
jgi:glycosyltransferase involved in cell wall biosynthesis